MKLVDTKDLKSLPFWECQFESGRGHHKFMSEKHKNIYSFLLNSYFYNFLQSILGATNFRKKFIKDLNIKKNAKILDIGSGTSIILKFLNEPTYYGYDVNSNNIDYAKKKFGDKGIFYNKPFTKEEVTKLPKFDYIFLFGFIHHVNDEEILKLLKLLKTCLSKDGCVCSIDGVIEKNQNPIAKFLILKDRGKFVRTKESYIKIAKKIFSKVDTSIIHWKLFPYTYMTMIMK